jgi:transposase IS4-like protein
LAQSVITRRIVVAGGVFAPGRLGELTRIVPFEMIDAVLADCGALQRRVRKLPARVVVYLLLAAALFEPIGYLAVWRKLTGALEGTGVAKITAAALWQARTRLGPAPLRALFDLLCGSTAAPRTSGSWWRGLLVCAIDGTALDVPDTPGHRARLGKRDNQYAIADYPQIRLVALVACGTRAIIGAVFGPAADGEPSYVTRLLHCLHEGMIVLTDRGLSSNALLAAITGTGAVGAGVATGGALPAPRLGERRVRPTRLGDAASGDLPLVGELDHLKDDRRLQAGDAPHPAEPVGDEIEEVPLVEEERLHDDVVAAGGHADVANLPLALEFLADLPELRQRHRDADDGRQVHAHRPWCRHRDDIDQAARH